MTDCDERGPSLIYHSDSGMHYRLDQLADEWFKARQERPEVSVSKEINTRDAAILRGLLGLAQAYNDDPGDGERRRA